MTSLTRNNLAKHLLPWMMWSLGALVFFIEYLIRVAPGSMIPSLMRTFQASSLDISAFSAYFLYAYVLMQIPVGLLVDRFGARGCLSLSTALCSFSTFLFTWTDDLLIAQAARLLLGFGAAFALVGTLKLALLWFKAEAFSVLVGITQSLGMVGGAAGICILGRLAELEDWQISFQFFGVVLGLLALVIALFVRNTPSPSKSKYLNSKENMTFKLESHLSLLQAIKMVLKSRQTWLISIYAGLLYMPTAVFAELWGSFYLSETQHLSVTVANDGISTIFVGWAIGGPLCGILANRFGRRAIMIFSAITSTIFISGILYLPPIPIFLLYSFLFAYGLCNSGMVAAYTAIAELNPKAVAGVALGFGNGMSVIVGAFCQQIVGALIDWFHANNNYTVNVTPHELKMAMSIIIVGIGFALIISFFTKETLHHEQVLS